MWNPIGLIEWKKWNFWNGVVPFLLMKTLDDMKYVDANDVILTLPPIDCDEPLTWEHRYLVIGYDDRTNTVFNNRKRSSLY